MTLIFALFFLGFSEAAFRPWYFDTLNLDQAWKITKGNSNGLIALVDSGVNYKLPFLKQNIWLNPGEKPDNRKDNDGNGFNNDMVGWDFVQDDNKPLDVSAHGTWLASFMVATATPGSDHPQGICPKCELMPVRFIDDEGYGDDEALIESIYYAIDNGAKVINLATSAEGYDGELKAAIAEAGKKDILVIAAASNDSEDLDKASTYPAKFKFPHMVTVASVTEDGDLSARSNWGNESVHFGAPGDHMTGYWIDSEDDGPAWFYDDEEGEGTSDACAVTSAVAGLVRSANPKLSAEQTKKILMKTVQKSPDLKNKVITGGIIDAGAAVKCAVDPKLSCLR